MSRRVWHPRARYTGNASRRQQRSPDVHYRTTPLRGAWSRATGGYYHDGRFPTLGDVVDHYDAHFTLGVSEAERTDLVEYLKSL